jgi:hypothetical protein
MGEIRRSGKDIVVGEKKIGEGKERKLTLMKEVVGT